MPTGDQAYSFELPDGVDRFIPQGAADPAVKALMDTFKADGMSQAELNACWKAVKVLGEKGVWQPPFDPAAETAALGDGGSAMQQEQQTWLSSLKDRGDLGDKEFGELMTLVPTAAGTRALQQLRKIMTTDNAGGAIVAPTEAEAAATAAAEAQKAAREMRLDPRYGADRKFKKDADAAYMAAFKKD